MMKSVLVVGVVAASAFCSSLALAEDPAPGTAAGASPTRVEPLPLTAMPSSCLTQTGSQIKAAPGTCLMAVGHSYDRKDLDSTGGATLGDAMSRLDPTLTVTHR